MPNQYPSGGSTEAGRKVSRPASPCPQLMTSCSGQSALLSVARVTAGHCPIPGLDLNGEVRPIADTRTGLLHRRPERSRPLPYDRPAELKGDVIDGPFIA